jgi:hypothetical protein
MAPPAHLISKYGAMIDVLVDLLVHEIEGEPERQAQTKTPADRKPAGVPLHQCDINRRPNHDTDTA